MRRECASAVALVTASNAAHAADGAPTDWLPWLVLGAIAVFILGIVLRMVLAARFPKGYGSWAARRRDAFAANTEAWDRDDEEFRR
jgi:hypothetical protein